MKNYCLIILCCLIYSCKNSDHNDLLNDFVINYQNSPCNEGGESNLHVSEAGDVFLSWIEYQDDSTDVLVFSILENNYWSDPVEIARGNDWFINWADFPSLVTYNDGGQSMAAHWLQKSAAGTYDYDVRISQSNDGGENWTPSFIPHRDGISAEHGFVSMIPLSENAIFATWLDGRNTKVDSESDKNHNTTGHGHHGAMTLRGAQIDRFNNLSGETELDARVCDCCQTSVAMTDQGLIVAYRDRNEDEIRDIGIVRQVNDQWLEPEIVYHDNWKIAGCPVNGPAIDAIGKQVGIAWFSMPEGSPEVKVSFSQDSGNTFSLPIQIDNGNPLGRVDLVMLENSGALVSWMEAKENMAEIKMVRINPEGVVSDTRVIASSSASRQSGFPRMVRRNNDVIISWTQADSTSTIQSAIVTLNGI